MENKINLFNKLPDNFFSILAGSLKEIHMELLFLVYEHYKKTIYVIDKEIVIDLFVEYLEIHNDEIGFKDENGDEEFIKGKRERAHYFLLKFCQHGWLRQEQYLDYKYRITIPDYAVKILDTFEKITIGYQMEFSGTVLAVYQNLSGNEGNTYYAIQKAHEDTLILINGLKELNHNIKYYMEKLMEQENAKEVLEQLFNEYGEKVLGKHYYRLKSSDNISKYRTKIIDKVRDIRHSLENIELQAQIMVKEEFAETTVEAENQLFLWLETMENAFEYIYEILSEIDARNRMYHSAAITKIKFHLNKTGYVTSKINKILIFLSNVVKEGNDELKDLTVDKLVELIDLFNQAYIDDKSLKLGYEKKAKVQQSPMKSRKVNNETRFKKIKEYREQLQNEITVQKINDFVSKVLDRKDKGNLYEFPLSTNNDYVNIIFTILHSTNHKSNYRLKLKDKIIKKIEVENGIVPNMEIEKKEKRDGMG